MKRSWVVVVGFVAIVSLPPFAFPSLLEVLFGRLEI
jgi:hypothetical protein